MTQKKRTIKCSGKEQRYTTIRINKDDRDIHAARSFEQAMDLANPDRGDLVEVFATCAQDVAEARMPHVRAQRVRAFKYKGGR